MQAGHFQRRRRRGDRSPLSEAVIIEDTDDGCRVEAVGRNWSNGGLCVRTPIALSPGQSVVCGVLLPVPLSLSCSVVWSRLTASGDYDAGLVIEEPFRLRAPAPLTQCWDLPLAAAAGRRWVPRHVLRTAASEGIHAQAQSALSMKVAASVGLMVALLAGAVIAALARMLA